MDSEHMLPRDQSATEPVALLATKLRAPLLREQLVPRTQLIARLDQGLRQGHRLVLVTGPAGSGKTTLVATWLQEAQRTAQRAAGEHLLTANRQLLNHVAWLALDAGDNDPQRFFSYLLAALRQVAPTLDPATASLLGGPQLPTPEALIIPLLNDLAALPGPLALVLDDYHLIDAPIIHEAITLLIERRPPQLHLVIVSRADPPLPLPRLRARDQLTEVRATALRFTPEESAAFFHQTMPLPLDAESLRLLTQQTEGWAAGLQLAALSLRDRTPEECAAFVQRFGACSQYVIDYLVDEVLNQQPPYRKAFLLQTAILDRLCGPLCDAVLGVTSEQCHASRITHHSYSQRLLEELEHANLFLIPLDSQRRWYRYHPLFAAALRTQLAAEPKAQAELHRRAASWFATQGLWEAGVRHAPAAGDLHPQPLAEALSAQEQTVLRLLGQGCSNQMIAKQLVISVGTAKWHVHNLYGKLGVSGRLHAVTRARELSLL